MKTLNQNASIPKLPTGLLTKDTMSPAGSGDRNCRRSDTLDTHRRVRYNPGQRGLAD